MSEQDNVKVALATFDNLNAHDLDSNDALSSDDAKFEAPGAPGALDRAQGRAYTQGFLTAFPDLHFDVTLTVAQGDHVVVNWVGSGTHTGPMLTPSGNSIPPTGKKAVTPGSSTLEIKNGKVTRNQVYFDMATLLGQLGLLPPM
jgi:steroid delta-isomerase-like uncharacterized protein